MAIFIIGVQKLNNERHFRLFNTKVNENNVRDISEKDLTYLMRGNSNFKVQNAAIKDGKIIGTTGSLDKFANEVCYTVIGAINENGNLAGYRFADTMGNVYHMRMEESVQFLNGKPIQNASVVNGSYIRGINWEIPVIQDNKSDKVNTKSNAVKPIYLHVDARHMNYVFSKEMKGDVQFKLPEEYISEEQFLIYIDSFVYTAYVPEDIYKHFVSGVREKLRVHCNIFGRKDNMMEIQVPYAKKGFATELEVLNQIASELNAKLEVSLMISNAQKREDIAGYYENTIWNIISDAKSAGMKMKKYFFLGSDNTVFGNLKGCLLDYLPYLDRQLRNVTQTLGIKYTCNVNKGIANGKIKVIDYVPMDTSPYGCILLEMDK